MNLNIDSICTLSVIIDKLQIDDKLISELSELGSKANEENESERERIKTEIGMKIVIKLTSKLHLVKNELIELIAMAKNITEEEAKKEDVIEFLKELVKDKGFQNFFKLKAMSK